MDDSILHVAQIITGEAGGWSFCGPLAMLAVYYILRENPRMLGHAETPDPGAIFIAALGDRLPNPVKGKQFLFSEEDLKLPHVQRIILDRPPPKVFVCRAGMRLYAY